MKFSRSPPLNVTSLEWSPLIIFDDFRDPPPSPIVFIFQANLSFPPSESFQRFQRSPLLFGFSVTTDPPFCSPKNQVISQNPTPPFPCLQAINDDRSLNKVTPNWLDINQLPIYKCGRGFEPWTIANKSSWRSWLDLNSGSPNCKSSALMAQSRCPLSLIFWETAHLPLP